MTDTSRSTLGNKKPGETSPDAQSAHTSGQASDQNLDALIPIRLKALRTALGISAATLDRQAGLAPGTTGRLERGDQRVYGAHLHHICTATGIAMGYFYTPADETGDHPEAMPDAPPGASAQELEKQRLLLAYMKIKDPALKRDVFELVETLANECGAKPG